MVRTRVIFFRAFAGISALIFGRFLVTTALQSKGRDASLRPPFTENPSCPVTLVLRCPSNAGVGHRVATALIGLDVALKTGSRLVLAKDYWSTGSHDTNYVWFESGLWPIRRLKGVTAAAAADIDVATLLRHGAQCGNSYRLHAGEEGNCGPGSYCLTVFPGALHRGVIALHSARQQLSSPVASRRAASPPPAADAHADAAAAAAAAVGGDRPVEVLWHLRVGDAVLRVEPETIASLKMFIDAGFRKRGTAHVAIADQHRLDDVRREFPTLEGDLGFELRTQGANNEEAAFSLLRNAEVLVSTGSSFAIAAAAAAETGAQVHFFFPPKEADNMYVCGPVSSEPPFQCLDPNVKPKSEVELRALDAWRTYFMARNTIPVSLDGNVFSGYKLKAERMMRRADHDDGHGDWGSNVLFSFFVPWMPFLCTRNDDLTPFVHSEFFV